MNNRLAQDKLIPDTREELLEELKNDQSAELGIDGKLGVYTQQ